MSEFLEYDGQAVHWRNPADGKKEKSYPATSGLPGVQTPSKQCAKDEGPIPEGTYVLVLEADKVPAKNDGSGQCNLKPSRLIQQIPRGKSAGECEEFWANWGEHRVRIEAADKKTLTACAPSRGGFYLHDSTKGFSHGCIEVDGAFFTRLYEYAGKRKGRRLNIKVKYAFPLTYGGTKRP